MVRAKDLLKILTPEQAAAAGIVPGVARGSGRSPHTATGRKVKSKNEATFEQYLGTLHAAGVVRAFKYEPLSMRVQLAKKTTYRPDFLVLVWTANDVLPSGLVLVEVKPRQSKTGKAYWQGESRAKAKIAAEALRGLIPLVAVWPNGSGGWDTESL